MKRNRFGIIGQWIRDTSATAMAEFALIFPLLFVMLIGVFEIGSAINANQKAIAAAYMVADLLTRGPSVDDEEMDEAIKAGQLAMAPLTVADIGFDVVSMQFDEDDEPQAVWRETTENMVPDDDVFDEALGLGMEGDGVLSVTVSYVYRPFFGSIVIDQIPMLETAFARGRKTAVVSRD